MSEPDKASTNEPDRATTGAPARASGSIPDPARADDPRVQPIAFATRDAAEKHLRDLARETCFEDVALAGEEWMSYGINAYGEGSGVALWFEQAKDADGRGLHGTKVGIVEIVAQN